MWRVVDVSESGRTLSLSRGSLQVSEGSHVLGKVPLDDIQAVIVHGHGAMISLSLSAALAEAGIPLVLCASNHSPVAVTLPVVGNFEQASRQRSQADAPQTVGKRLWQKLIRAKIAAQAEALSCFGHPDAPALRKYAAKVRSGDPDNIEGQAARYYWPRAMGPAFRRDPDGGGANGALNYGYTILRSAVARAVVAAGLAPSLGLHHRHRLNGFQLVDDLIEPYRPLVDVRVRRRWDDLSNGLDRDGKAWLADMVTLRIATEEGEIALPTALGKSALSVAQAYQARDPGLLWLPEIVREVSQERISFDELD